MTYYYCRFLSYMVVVLTNGRAKALDRLIEYIRVTKGNFGYSEEEIREKARVDVIEVIDDLGYLKGLGDVSKKIISMKREFEGRLNDELREVERLKRGLREVARLIVEDEEE